MKPFSRFFAALCAGALIVGIGGQRAAAFVILNDDNPPGNRVTPTDDFRRPIDFVPGERRDILYSVSTVDIPGVPAASLQAVFEAFATWGAAANSLHFINVTPGHVDPPPPQGVPAKGIPAVPNPGNANFPGCNAATCGATIDVLWSPGGVPGVTGNKRYAADRTFPVGENGNGNQDNYTHIDITLRSNLEIVDPAAPGVRRLDNPLTNPFSIFTTQDRVDIRSVALHEIGHALGLDHPDVEVQRNPARLFSPFVATRAAAAANPVHFVNEDNFFRAHPADGLPAPPYNIHNQFEGTASAVMNSIILRGQISHELTPDELGAIGIMYGDDGARASARARASAASLSFGPDRVALRDILIERDIHRLLGGGVLEDNDQMPLQVLPPDVRLVGNLYRSAKGDPQDRYHFTVPEIPPGARGQLLIFDLDAGRISEDQLGPKSGDLRFRVLTDIPAGALTIDGNRDHVLIDPGSLYADDPHLAHVFTPRDIELNRGSRQFILEVSRDVDNTGSTDVDYIIQICGAEGGPQQRQQAPQQAPAACVCVACGPLDYGDAPDTYLTVAVSEGPRYEEGDLQRLGLLWDSEPDGQPTPLADGDDLSLLGGFPFAVDDEDGVVFGSRSVDVTFKITREGLNDYLLRAWWDKNGNDCFDHTTADVCNTRSEKFIDDPLTLGPGIYNRHYDLDFDPRRFYSRFRLTWDPREGDVWPYKDFGSRADGISHGEVEDYPPAIPLPSTLGLIGIGLAGLAASSRRRKSFS